MVYNWVIFCLSLYIDLKSYFILNLDVLYLIYKFCIYCNIGGAATNKHQVTTKNTAKLDRETEELKHDKVPIDLGRLIQQGRQAKGFNQKELATVS